MNLVQLPTGVSLEVELTESPLLADHGQGKLAVCLHPWSWLGGQMDDLCVTKDNFSQLLNSVLSRVLLSLQDSLQAKGYRVLRYNSRGVGRSTGWASFTGFSEAKDLEALIKWVIDKFAVVHSLVIVVGILTLPDMLLSSDCFTGLFVWLSHRIFAPDHSLSEDFAYTVILPSGAERLAYLVPYERLHNQTQRVVGKCRFQRPHHIWRPR